MRKTGDVERENVSVATKKKVFCHKMTLAINSSFVTVYLGGMSERACFIIFSLLQQQQQVTYLSIFLIFDQLIERNVSKGCYAHATDAAAATTAEPPAAKYGRSRRRKLSADSHSKSI